MIYFLYFIQDIPPTLLPIFTHGNFTGFVESISFVICFLLQFPFLGFFSFSFAFCFSSRFAASAFLPSSAFAFSAAAVLFACCFLAVSPETCACSALISLTSKSFLFRHHHMLSEHPTNTVIRMFLKYFFSSSTSFLFFCFMKA